MSAVVPPKDLSIPLSRILDEYADWFVQVIRHGFYSGPDQSSPAVTDVFSQWYDNAQKMREVESSILNQILSSHKSMIVSAEKIMSTKGTLPTAKDFDSFTQYYDGFVAQIRRLEWDSLLADSGIDYLTGLRSENALVVDLERELERRARRGQPFSIVMCRLNNYESIIQQGPAARDDVVKQAATALFKCIRSFDDAYRFGQHEFVTSLKHSDSDGALKFVARLRNVLDDMGVQFSMSYCVAEPMPGDDVKQLLKNVQVDLSKISSSPSGEVGRYAEISALQRFVNNIKE